MLVQLLLSTALVLLTVAVHGLGLALLIRMLGMERDEETLENLTPLSKRGIGFTLAVVLALFALHGVEIWTYAFAYLALGTMPDLATAVYFSTITYATIGYDDLGFDQAWRLVAAIEGINGIILMGWSTAFFVSFIDRLRAN